MAVELRPFGVACNIACRYCYQNPQREAGNVRQAYDLELMKAAVRREGGPFTLFGGEPLLLPLADLEELLRWGFSQYGGSTIQTNGVLLNDEHLRLFRAYRVDVGVSIDGPDELNDLRWHGSLERTRKSTALTLTNIARLCREHRPPGLIVTLHRCNATPERLPRLRAWMSELDTLGVRSVRLHLLEAESAEIRRAYGLTAEENVRALLFLSEVPPPRLRFDALDEMTQALRGRDRDTACVWHACDPYTTSAVRGVEGNGQSSNCGRTNKDGIDFLKADRPGFERSLALYRTSQEHGGCAGCRFFLMCKGQCPGTAIDGDWRNRSELCEVWMKLFAHLEAQMLRAGEVPLSKSPALPRLEQQLLQSFSRRATPVRHAFVHQQAQTAWAPRIPAARAALARLGVAAARQSGHAIEVGAAAEDVIEIHNLAARSGLHTRLLGADLGRKCERMAIGTQHDVAAYARVLKSGDTTALEALTQIPACCRRSLAEDRLTGKIDPLWRFATAGLIADATDAELSCPPALNMLLRPLGIDLLGYVPCHPHCVPSRLAAEARLALAAENGLAEPLQWFTAMLQWPAEWSALHGIAEVKTGILKFIYGTDFTAEKRTLRYRGERPAPEAAQGLTFPYRAPAPRRRLHLLSE